MCKIHVDGIHKSIEDKNVFIRQHNIVKRSNNKQKNLCRHRLEYPGTGTGDRMWVNGHVRSKWCDENFLKWFMVIAQLGKFTRDHSIVYLKWENYMMCKISLNKVFFLKSIWLIFRTPWNTVLVLPLNK